MLFKINYIPTEDYIIVEGDSIEEIRAIARKETDLRGWDSKDCWFEKIIIRPL